MSTAAVHRNMYRENQALSYLSPTYRSDVIHTPGDTRRRTASAENYDRTRATEAALVKPPWGRKYSYGGLGPISLPDEHRPKGEPPVRVVKGHLHYGSGTTPHPRKMTIEQQYDITSLRKSKNRINDELIPSMNEINLNPVLINKKFPSAHPYASHIADKALFPSDEHPPPGAVDAHARAKEGAPLDGRLPAECAAAADTPQVDYKTKGSMGRQELVRIPLDSQQRPMSFPAHDTYFQVLKGTNQDQTWYYPIPTKIGYSNTLERPEKERVRARTQSAERDLRQDYLKSIYQNDFSSSTAGKNTYLALEDRVAIANDGRYVNEPAKYYPDSLIRNLASANIAAKDMAYGARLAAQYTPSSAQAEDAEDSADRSAERVEANEEEEEEDEEEEHPGTVLNNMRSSWSETEARRQFHAKHPDEPPPLRKFPDQRITVQEKRHFVAETASPAHVWHGQGYYPTMRSQSCAANLAPLSAR